MLLTTVRRSRTLLIRCGLGLIAVVSLVAAVPLISNALNATTPLDSVSARFASASEAGRTITDSDLDSSVAIVPESSSADEIALTARAQEHLASLVRTDAPIDGMPLLTSDHGFPIETILAPVVLVGIDDLAMIASIEPAAADWLPMATEATQLARANISGSGAMGGGGGAFGGGGAGGFGGGAFSDPSSGNEFAGGSEGSGSIAALVALRGGDSAAAAGASYAADVITARSSGSASGSRRQDGDDNDRNNGNHRSNNGSNGSNGGASRGSGSGGPNDSTRVPEPSTMLLMAVGAASMAARRLRRRGTSAS